MANSSLTLTSLDFDSLKDNFKTFLQTQTVFKDYDYESSNMNVLLSVLAYNTYLNSFYLNMAISESFLDTAQLRDSVISHAKLLNYTPTSYKSPKALIDYTFVSNQQLTGFAIPKGTPFSGTNANGSFVYMTDRDHVITSGNTTYTITGLEIYEGSYINETFTFDTTVENQRFFLSNETIDTDSLQITVYENNNVDVYEYIRADNLYGVSSNSYVFFLQAYKNQFELVFGDGIFGRTPLNGATILATYRITNGTDGGGVSSFLLDKDLGAYNSTLGSSTVAINSAGSAGANAESIESIRYRAPRYYQTQDRAITKNDYKTLILNQFTEVKAVNVYGGEEVSNNAINYGKIFISPLTYAGAIISDLRKKDIINYIKDKMTIGLTPVVIDPETLFVVNEIIITYNPTITNKTPTEIVADARITINNFNDKYLKNFDTSFKFSKFTEALLNFDPSIITNQINVFMKKIVTPTLFKSESINFTFNNAIIPGSIQSSTFLNSDGLEYSFVDFNPLNNTLSPSITGVSPITNSTNLLYLKLNDPTKQSYTTIGTVDYETGEVAISNLIIADFLSSVGIEFVCSSVYDDIYTKNNSVIELDVINTSISVKTA
jgi:hypothetical protein